MKIALSGGGTAGHITPLLAVAEQVRLKEPQAEVVFIGQKGDKNTEIMTGSDLISRSHVVRAGKFRRFHSLSLWQNITNVKVNILNIRDAVWVVIGFFQSVWVLTRDRPDVIFFKGGFVVVPIGTAARFLRIPYITHDSDPLPGLANRLISKGAYKNAVALEGVTAYPAGKTVVSGIPLQKEYAERAGARQVDYRAVIDLPENVSVLLVIAGTQGSRVIDEAIQSMCPELLRKHPDLHIVHVFGRLNEHGMTSYDSLDPELKARVHPKRYVNDAYNYIASADLIVGRAGATTLAEIATIGRASIIVPAKQLTGGHQLLNAELYVKHNAIRVVEESDNLAGELREAVEELIVSGPKRQSLETNIRSLAPSNAAGTLADLIIERAR